MSTSDRLSDRLPHTLRLRLDVIAGAGTVGGLPTAGFLTRGDQALVDRGLVELRGDAAHGRLHLTRKGADLVRGAAA